MSKLLCSFSVSSIINNKPSVSCSDEGHVAVCGEDGIYILRIIASSVEVDNTSTFDISKIVAYTDFDVGITFNGKASYAEQIQLNLDRTFWTAPQQQQCYRGIKQCTWSPSDTGSNGSCLLAALLYSHDVIVYNSSNSQTWNKLCSIATQWQAYLEVTKWADVLESDEHQTSKFHNFEYKCHAQCATAICWSPIFINPVTNASQSLLAMSTMSGHIVLWRLVSATERDFTVACVMKSGSGLTSQLYFFATDEHTLLLCQGSSDGTATLHVLHCSPDGSMSVSCSVPLWSETDNIAVTGFSWSLQENALTLVKGTCVILLWLDWSSSVPRITTTTVKQIETKYAVCNVECLPDRLYISTLEGNVYCGKVKEDRSVTLEQVDVQWKSLTPVKIHDCAWSRNQIFCIIIECPMAYSGQFGQKNSLKVNWLCVKSYDEIAEILMGHIGKLCDVIDALMYVKHETALGCPLPSALQTFVNDHRRNRSGLSLYHLKLLRYLMRLLLIYPSHDSQCNITKQELLMIDREIMTVYVKSLLVSHPPPPTLCSSSDSDGTIMLVMQRLLANSSAADEEPNKEQLLTDSSANETSSLEKCPVCQADVGCSSMFEGTCVNGHRFARCCQTLQLCWRVPYRVCVECNALAVSRVVNANESCDGKTLLQRLLVSRCTYCDGRLQ